MTTDATPPGSDRRSTPEQDSWMKQYLGLDIDKYEAEAKAKLGEAGTAVADAGKSAVSHVKATAVAAGEGIEEAGKAVAAKAQEAIKAAFEFLKEAGAIAVELKHELEALKTALSKSISGCHTQAFAAGSAVVGMIGSIIAIIATLPADATPAAVLAAPVTAAAIITFVGSAAGLFASVDACIDCRTDLIEKAAKQSEQKEKDAAIEKQIEDLKKEVDDLKQHRTAIHSAVTKMKALAGRAPHKTAVTPN